MGSTAASTASRRARRLNSGATVSIRHVAEFNASKSELTLGVHKRSGIRPEAGDQVGEA
jgi:hypothetical protein